MGHLHTHRLLKSLSYSFKARRTPRWTEIDQLIILGRDLDRSNLAHETKLKKFLSEKWHFAFHYCKGSKKRKRMTSINVFKIVRHNYYARRPWTRCHPCGFLTKNNVKRILYSTIKFTIYGKLYNGIVYRHFCEIPAKICEVSWSFYL